MNLIKAMLVFMVVLLMSCCSNEAAKMGEDEIVVHYKYNFRDELNSRDSVYVKDLVGDDTISTKLYLTREEKLKIVDFANAMKFYEMPDTLEFHDDVQTIPEPGMQMLYIKHGDIEKRVHWRAYEFNNVDKETYERVIKLGAFIDAIVKGKEEYKRLPPPKGGYR